MNLCFLCLSTKKWTRGTLFFFSSTFLFLWFDTPPSRSQPLFATPFLCCHRHCLAPTTTSFLLLSLPNHSFTPLSSENVTPPWRPNTFYHNNDSTALPSHHHNPSSTPPPLVNLIVLVTNLFSSKLDECLGLSFNTKVTVAYTLVAELLCRVKCDTLLKIIDFWC